MNVCVNTTQPFKVCYSYNTTTTHLKPHPTYLPHQTTQKMTPMVEGPSGKRIKSAKQNPTSEHAQKKKERKINYVVTIKILPCHNPLTRSRHCFEYDPAFPAASYCHPQPSVSVKQKYIHQVFTVRIKR